MVEVDLYGDSDVLTETLSRVRQEGRHYRYMIFQRDDDGTFHFPPELIREDGHWTVVRDNEGAAIKIDERGLPFCFLYSKPAPVIQ